ncbi:hypothetical protein FKM82_025137 [Ascaphus truei]
MRAGDTAQLQNEITKFEPTEQVLAKPSTAQQATNKGRSDMEEEVAKYRSAGLKSTVIAPKDKTKVTGCSKKVLGKRRLTKENQAHRSRWKVDPEMVGGKFEKLFNWKSRKKKKRSPKDSPLRSSCFPRRGGGTFKWPSVHGATL